MSGPEARGQECCSCSTATAAGRRAQLQLQCQSRIPVVGWQILDLCARAHADGAYARLDAWVCIYARPAVAGMSDRDSCTHPAAAARTLSCRNQPPNSCHCGRSDALEANAWLDMATTPNGMTISGMAVVMADRGSGRGPLVEYSLLPTRDPTTRLQLQLQLSFSHRVTVPEKLYEPRRSR